MTCVEMDDLILKSEPVFTWRFSLSTHPLKAGRPKVSLHSLHYELAATLLTHALCLTNLSTTLVSALGSYEISSSASSATLKQHDESINSAAELLCRASGILSYLSETVIPRWESAVGEDIKGRPIELSRDVVTALSKLTLADANHLAIRRLLSRSQALSHSTTTPGPPLPTSHPSPSLLAKLHLQIYTLYDESRSLCKTASRLSPDASGEVSDDLRKYLSQGRTVAQCLGWKWLGVDAGENGGREKAGMALAWLGAAKSGLEELSGGGSVGGRLKMIGKSGKKGKEKERKGKVGKELDSVNAFLSAYKKVNDTLHFQPIPPLASLQSLVPAGRSALNAKPFTPPEPAFKPRQSRTPILPPDLDIKGLNLDGDSSDDENLGTTAGGGDETYFGAGNYW